MSALHFERVGRYNGVGIWLVVVDNEGVGELWRGTHNWCYEEYDMAVHDLAGCKDARAAKKEVTKRLGAVARRAPS